MFMIQSIVGAILLIVSYRAGLSIGMSPEASGWSAFGLFIVFHTHMLSALVAERRRVFNQKKAEFLKEEERLRKLKNITRGK